MPSITIELPDALMAPQPAETVTAEATTVRDAFAVVAARRPELAERLMYGGRPLVSVLRNGEALPPGTALGAALEAGDRLKFLPPVAGG